MKSAAVYVMFCCAAPAAADTLVITYASGKVQKVELDGKAEDVQDVKFGESAQPLGDRVRGFLFGKPAPDRAVSQEREKDARKPGSRIDWAPPLSE